jgi:3-hydroxyisobutyrate dehydrogenase
MKVGFIGLGRMGLPMATHLLAAGHSLTVFNRSQASVQKLVENGAQAASSPADVASRVDVLFTCLLSPQQTEAVLLGENGAIHGARRGQIFVDTETVDPATTLRFAQAVSKSGVMFVDAPISGGPAGAAAGTLTVMVGADESAFRTVRPLFRTYGRNIFHLGGVGSGVAAKLCNQILTAANHALVAEAMVLGAKLGLDPHQLFDVLRVSSGQSRALENCVPRAILPRDFSPVYTIDGILKDLACALSAASERGVPLQLPALAAQMYQAARDQGHGAKDMSSVMLPLEVAAGIEVKAT